MDRAPNDNADEQPASAAEQLVTRLSSFVLRHLFSAIIALLVLVFLVVLWLSQRLPEITPAKFDQIQNGMTEAEVEQVLGGTASLRPPTKLPTLIGTFAPPPTWKAWDDGKTLVLIAFVDGRVRFKQRTPAP